ncbi:BON domain-containing protein [Variovorax paradoxus]|uniref:BON domain-containing protein n=1 Tax=Variovorax paradoxus TaxID=34073 RepID=UPI0027896C40|nr:BON domain-containing protein [Variovorax paradoxus]MDQ0591087.1 hypothetical protein [Variovorax paradoxus]
MQARHPFVAARRVRRRNAGVECIVWVRSPFAQKDPQETLGLQHGGKVRTLCADSVDEGHLANHAADGAAGSPLLLLLERFEMNPDIQLRHEVFAQLNWDPAVCGCDVDVRVTDGVVTLHGRLASEDLKSAVERAVRRTEGITLIVNRLTTAECANND